MNYRVLIADEALADIFGLVQYIHTELCNPDATEKLYENLNRETKKHGRFSIEVFGFRNQVSWVYHT